MILQVCLYKRAREIHEKSIGFSFRVFATAPAMGGYMKVGGKVSGVSVQDYRANYRP